MFKTVRITIQNLFLLGSVDLTADLSSIQQRIKAMSEALDTLITRVSEIESVADSAIELIAGLKAKLDEAIANNDTAALQDLSARLGAQAQELADAILVNTPAEPEGAEPPAP